MKGYEEEKGIVMCELLEIEFTGLTRKEDGLKFEIHINIIHKGGIKNEQILFNMDQIP